MIVEGVGPARQHANTPVMHFIMQALPQESLHP
jgi:hypothetical protein